MPKKGQRKQPATVRLQEIEMLADALKAMAASCDDAGQRMRDAGTEDVQSTNYQSGLLGFLHMAKFVRGLAGLATTSAFKELGRAEMNVEALVEALKTGVASDAQSLLGGPNKKVAKARPARRKK